MTASAPLPDRPHNVIDHLYPLYHLAPADGGYRTCTMYGSPPLPAPLRARRSTRGGA